MTLFPFQSAHTLQDTVQDQAWLIEGLWSDQAVGIVGGEPKCYKSFLALDMAVSVASATPCLRRYPVRRKGSVLLYAAEDSFPEVKKRLVGICSAAGVTLADCDIQVITAPTLRLDLEDDRMRLSETVEHLQPSLLLLDPFVRLHRIDENASREVAPILDFLRTLQRQLKTAVVVVHHSKKGAGKTRAGQALRGSSEFHAWVDSFLYLRRVGDQLNMTVEHRSAPSQTGICVELHSADESLALRYVERVSHEQTRQERIETPQVAIEHVLQQARVPLLFDQIRNACHARTQTVSTALAALVEQGRVQKTSAGYKLPVSTH
jgi:hypothetical protein